MATETQKVQCVKCGKAGEPITDPLFMGRLESEIKAKICKTCWKEWEGMKVMVINEYQVNLGEESGRELVKKQMRAFLKLGEAVDNSKLQQNFRPVS
jgi:Fe-S cluster biosynthesis and repair protein YggX